jgi:hypothetical protein
VEPIGGLARVRGDPGALAEHERALLRGGEPLVRSEDERLTGCREEVRDLRHPGVAPRQEVLGRVGRPPADRGDTADVPSEEPVLEGEQERDRVLEGAARDTTALRARHHVHDDGARDGDRRRGSVREGDRGAPGVAMTPERRGRLLGLAARGDPHRDGARSPRRRGLGARVLRDGVQARGPEPRRDHGGRVPGGTHPEQHDAPGPRWDRAPYGGVTQGVGERAHPFRLRLEVVEEQLGIQRHAPRRSDGIARSGTYRHRGR